MFGKEFIVHRQLSKKGCRLCEVALTFFIRLEKRSWMLQSIPTYQLGQWIQWRAHVQPNSGTATKRQLPVQSHFTTAVFCFSVPFFLAGNKYRFCSLYKQVWQSGVNVSPQFNVLRICSFIFGTGMLSYAPSPPVWGREALLSRGFQLWPELFALQKVLLSKEVRREAAMSVWKRT